MTPIPATLSAHGPRYATDNGIDHIEIQYHHAHLRRLMAEHEMMNPSSDGVRRHRLRRDGTIWEGGRSCLAGMTKAVGHPNRSCLAGMRRCASEPGGVGASVRCRC